MQADMAPADKESPTSQGELAANYLDDLDGGQPVMASKSLFGGSSKKAPVTPVDQVAEESKRSPPPTLGFLNRAHVCSLLSQKVYAEKAAHLDFSTQYATESEDPKILKLIELNDRTFPSFGRTEKQVRVDPNGPQIPASFEAKYVDSHIFTGLGGSPEMAFKFCQERNFNPLDHDLAAVTRFLEVPEYVPPAVKPSQGSTPGTPDPLEIQWSIWYVTDLGYVAAFKGSVFLEDWMANFQISSKQLESISPYSSITVHKGIFRWAKQAWKDVVNAIRAHAKGNAQLSKDHSGKPIIPVLLTGGRLIIMLWPLHHTEATPGWQALSWGLQNDGP